MNGWVTTITHQQGIKSMNAKVALAGFAFLLPAIIGTGASATELKVLSVQALKPALQELAPAFEKTSSDKVTVEYAKPNAIAKKAATGDDLNNYDVVIADKAEIEKLYKSAKVAGGSIRVVAMKGPKEAFSAGAPMFGPNPALAQTLINFLNSPSAASAYKSAGLQPPPPKKED
jgi:ABC-type molybdate transport system substrate-binding protein